MPSGGEVSWVPDRVGAASALTAAGGGELQQADTDARSREVQSGRAWDLWISGC